MVLPSDTILYLGTKTIFFVRGIMEELYVEYHGITMFLHHGYYIIFARFP